MLAPPPPSPYSSNSSMANASQFQFIRPPKTAFTNARANAPRGPPLYAIEFHSTNAPSTRILVYTADMTRLQVGAVVNSANKYLDLRDNMSSSLLAAAGYNLQLECNHILETRHVRFIPLCQNVYTSGGKLPASFVIHAVGPKGYRARDEYEFRQKLASTLENVFHTAQELQISSLAMPLISSGAVVKQNIIIKLN